MTTTIGLIAFDGCIGSSVHALADLFSIANTIHSRTGGEQTLFETRVLTPEGKQVTASNGHQIPSDGAITPEASYEVLMVPGIGIEAVGEIDTTLTTMRPLIYLLGAERDHPTIITASCTGTFLLAEAGLLQGKRATTTWWLSSEFSKRYPDIEMQANEILVDTGPVITSAAGTSYLDLALHVIRRLAGAPLAHLCAKFMIVDGGRTSQRPYSIPWHFMSRDPLVEKAEAWVKRRIDKQISVNALAEHLGLGARTLHRRFLRLTQQTPQAFIQEIRMQEAMRLLETTQQSVPEIGAKIGYGYENTFRRAFSTNMGTTPTQHRLRFQTK